MCTHTGPPASGMCICVCIYTYTYSALKLWYNTHQTNARCSVGRRWYLVEEYLLHDDIPPSHLRPAPFRSLRMRHGRARWMIIDALIYTGWTTRTMWWNNSPSVTGPVHSSRRELHRYSRRVPTWDEWENNWAISCETSRIEIKINHCNKSEWAVVLIHCTVEPL